MDWRKLGYKSKKNQDSEFFPTAGSVIRGGTSSVVGDKFVQTTEKNNGALHW